MKDYYTILGVSDEADQSEIKKSYRKLAMKYHPDRNNDPSAQSQFAEIQEAYDTIGNETKRKQYDFERANPHGGSFHFNRGDINSVFEEIFGNRFRHGFASQRQQRTVYNVICTLEELYAGCQKNVNGNRITIPKGMRDGSLIQVNGEMVRITLAPHKTFLRQNDNLVAQIQISALDAMVGTTIEVHHIDGKKYNLKVPAGTQPREALRMKGKGMPNPQIPSKTGDLYVLCDVTIPKDLTQDVKNSIIEGNHVKTYQL